MGQKGSKVEVSEDCLKPRQYNKCTDVDLRKLRALIRTGKLSPCYQAYEGEDWDALGLEECPICFLAYPALNRSQCCCKEICTECFLQVKLPNGSRGGALCPFCKAEFSVSFRGPNTAAEREARRAEELRVVQATLKAREADEREQADARLQRRSESARLDADSVRTACPPAHGSLAVGLEKARSEPPPPRVHAGSLTIARKSGDIDEEALHAVLAGLDLSEYIPSTTFSSADADLEDELLQRAIQASLADQGTSNGVVAQPAPVHREEVAFSPLALGANSLQHTAGLEALDSPGDIASSSQGPLLGDQQRETCWLDLGAGHPHAILSSPESSSSSLQPSPPLVTPISRKAAVMNGVRRHKPVPYRNPAATPIGRLFEGRGPLQQGCLENVTDPCSSALQQPPLTIVSPQAPPHHGFNALSTISSSTMEHLLLTTSGHDFETIAVAAGLQDNSALPEAGDSAPEQAEEAKEQEANNAGHLTLCKAELQSVVEAGPTGSRNTEEQLATAGTSDLKESTHAVEATEAKSEGPQASSNSDPDAAEASQEAAAGSTSSREAELSSSSEAYTTPGPQAGSDGRMQGSEGSTANAFSAPAWLPSAEVSSSSEGSHRSTIMLGRRSSGASSCGELIAALHTFDQSSEPPAHSALPAPPMHLKAFLSSGKPSSSGGMQQPDRAKLVERKGTLSFADLLNAKGRVRSAGRPKQAITPNTGSLDVSGLAPPEPCTVGMVLSRPARQSEQAAPTELPTAQTEPSSLVTPGPGSVLYEEPSSCSRMLAVGYDGSAVLLTEPDGTSRLVLLTRDQRKQMLAAQHRMQESSSDLSSYAAPSDASDQRMQHRLKEADEAMRKLFESLQFRPEDASSSDTAADDFAARLLKADQEFKAALERRAVETGIAGGEA